MAHEPNETSQGAELDALRWLRYRLSWENRLADLQRRAGSVANDELADRRDAVETSPTANGTRLPAAS